ncbi:MAG TPA: hypothetical protein VG014_05765 [Acidimicrobiales bacterium]|nr:hypothetical protein [Acidimicrobiales bacterium]
MSFADSAAAHSPDGDPDLTEWEGHMWASVDQRLDGAEEQLARFHQRRHEADRPFQELTADLEAEFAPKVVIATHTEDSPEARERRRVSAGVHQHDCLTGSTVHPNGSVSWPDDGQPGLPTIWD